MPWHDLARFHRHPLATYSFAFKAPPSKNVEKSFRRPIFHSDSSGIGISYIDQFAQPETIEQARYLFDLSQSLDARPSILSSERAAASRADAARGGFSPDMALSRGVN
jgi:protein CsiD